MTNLYNGDKIQSNELTKSENRKSTTNVLRMMSTIRNKVSEVITNLPINKSLVKRAEDMYAELYRYKFMNATAEKALAQEGINDYQKNIYQKMIEDSGREIENCISRIEKAHSKRFDQIKKYIFDESFLQKNKMFKGIAISRYKSWISLLQFSDEKEKNALYLEPLIEFAEYYHSIKGSREVKNLGKPNIQNSKDSFERSWPNLSLADKFMFINPLINDNQVFQKIPRKYVEQLYNDILNLEKVSTNKINNDENKTIFKFKELENRAIRSAKYICLGILDNKWLDLNKHGREDLCGVFMNNFNNYVEFYVNNKDEYKIKPIISFPEPNVEMAKSKLSTFTDIIEDHKYNEPLEKKLDNIWSKFRTIDKIVTFNDLQSKGGPYELESFFSKGLLERFKCELEKNQNAINYTRENNDEILVEWYDYQYKMIEKNLIVINDILSNADNYKLAEDRRKLNYLCFEMEQFQKQKPFKFSCK